jgi:GntR family transcriptional regulator
VKFQSKKVPLYYQIESILREKITSGKWSDGERLPTENELSDQFGVSRITVRQALASLVDEGMLQKRQGRGTFVSKREPVRGTMRLTGFIEDLISMGVATKVKLLDSETVPASEAEAAQLRVEVGTPLRRVKRLRYVKGTPFSYIVNYLPEEVGQNLSAADFASGSLLKRIEEKCDLEIGDATQVINASLADGYVASLLATNVGAPLLSIERTVHSATGRPIAYVQTLYRSDLYCYTVELVRGKSERGTGWLHKQS